MGSKAALSLVSPPPGGATEAAPAADHSRFVQRIRRRYSKELAWVVTGLPSRDSIVTLITRLRGEGHALGAAMRIARQLTLERLAVLDVEQHAALGDVTRVMTELAEATLELALAEALDLQDRRFGAPLDAAGLRIEFWIVGMGKLGARERPTST